MIAKSFAALACLGLLIVAGEAAAQDGPLVLSRPYAIHTLTGPNPGNRYVPGDVMRLGVFANHSDRPTSVVATLGTTRIDVPYYRGPIMDDLFDGAIPFEPTMVGAWTITVQRGAERVAVLTPAVPAVAVSLVDDLRIETVDGVPTVMWRWPDLSAALGLGLTPFVKILVMQEDNHDELILNFGLRDHPIVAGRAGETAAIAIPDELDPGMLFVFRVHLELLDPAGNVVAQSITFVQKPQPGP